MKYAGILIFIFLLSLTIQLSFQEDFHLKNLSYNLKRELKGQDKNRFLIIFRITFKVCIRVLGFFTIMYLINKRRTCL